MRADRCRGKAPVQLGEAAAKGEAAGGGLSGLVGCLSSEPWRAAVRARGCGFGFTVLVCCFGGAGVAGAGRSLNLGDCGGRDFGFLGFGW